MTKNHEDHEKLTRAETEVLDDLFAGLRERRLDISPDLAGRVLADAFEASPAPSIPPVRSSLLPRLAKALGGWRGGVALASSAMLGVWVGYANADLVSGVDPFSDGDVVTETLFDPSATRFDEYILEG